MGMTDPTTSSASRDFLAATVPLTMEAIFSIKRHASLIGIKVDVVLSLVIVVATKQSGRQLYVLVLWLRVVILSA